MKTTIQLIHFGDGPTVEEFEGCSATVDEDGEAWINDRDMNVIATYPPHSWHTIMIENDE